MITSIAWKFIQSLNMSDCHHSISRNEEYGVQLEEITRKRNDGGLSSPKRFFFIDGDDREFLSEDDLIDAYNELYPRDDESPANEVKYIKTIQKRNG